MLQLNPPLSRIIVGGPGWHGPTGKGVANFIDPGHSDDDMVWIIDLDDGGQTWCVPNRYVRAPVNITRGRTAAPPRDGEPIDATAAAAAQVTPREAVPARHPRLNGEPASPTLPAASRPPR